MSTDKPAITLAQLAALIDSRKEADASQSYTAQLLQQDEDILLKKIVEEAAEVVLAAKSGRAARLSEEIADLCFHCLVLMSRYNVTADSVTQVLISRQGLSGLAEKASRVASKNRREQNGNI